MSDTPSWTVPMVLAPLCPVRLIILEHEQRDGLFFALRHVHMFWRNNRWEETP